MTFDTQRCYICGTFYEDKVKLGLHLTPCYNEAVNVRREMWHPHPLDLVDEQRYTEYMRGKFQHREKQIETAQRQGKSFVTGENFDAIKSTLMPNRNIPVTGSGARSPSRGGGSSSPSSPAQARIPPPPSLPQVSRHVTVQPPPEHVDRDYRQREQVAAPVRQVATGVTMLRNELTEELVKIRQLRQTEEHLVEERQRVFEEMCGQVSIRKPKEDYSRAPPISYASPPRTEALLPVSRPQSSSSLLSPSNQLTKSHMFPLPPAQPVQRSLPTAEPRLTPDQVVAVEMPDGRIKCPWCSKLFGKKGYEVHVQRCSRPDNDFTWSRDADFVRENPEERVKADHDRVSYGRQHEADPNGRPAGMSDEAWTQFMVTYPRPILDERPKTSQERNAGVAQQAQKNAYNQMVQNELSRPIGGGDPARQEPTVACAKCGRYFYSSRLDRHEGSCVGRIRR